MLFQYSYSNNNLADTSNFMLPRWHFHSISVAKKPTAPVCPVADVHFIQWQYMARDNSFWSRKLLVLSMFQWHIVSLFTITWFWCISMFAFMTDQISVLTMCLMQSFVLAGGSFFPQPSLSFFLGTVYYPFQSHLSIHLITSFNKLHLTKHN